MKKLLSLLVLAACVPAVPACATPVTISLANPNQTGTVGQTLKYFGVITNNTGSTVSLDGDDLMLTAQGITLVDDFNDNVPFSLAPDGQAGASSGLIELFDVTLGAGFSGINLGTYDLTSNASGALGSTTFSVQPTAIAPTPEPASILLLLTGLPGVIVPMVRRVRR